MSSPRLTAALGTKESRSVPSSPAAARTSSVSPYGVRGEPLRTASTTA